MLIFIFLFWLVYFNVSYSKQYIDSLEISLYTEQEPVMKAEAMLSLFEELKFSNQEGALHYAQQALELSVTTGFLQSKLILLINFSNNNL